MNKPLRICLVAQGRRDWQGGTEYIKNLLLALAHLPQEFQEIFDCSLVSQNALDQDLQEQIYPHLSRQYIYNSKIKASKLLDKAYFRTESNLFYLKNRINFVYPYFSRVGFPKPFKTASWIPDFQHRYLPYFFSSAEIAGREKVFGAMARRPSNNIVLSSETAKADLHNCFPKSTANTFVLNFATFPNPTWHEGDPIQAQKKFNLTDKFFIISNQFWQHKNHIIVFKALKILQEKGIDPTVVCTGHVYDHRKPSYSDDVLQAIHQLGLANQVFLLGLIPRNDQILLMRRALAVVQPSLFEGWSTVIEDARCLGKHLILSDLPIHREQNPPHSLFYDPASAEQLASLMARYWDSLSPGPRKEDELSARVAAIKSSQLYGRKFLEIAYNCVYSKDLNIDFKID